MSPDAPRDNSVDMPAPTAAPLVLAVGISLMALGGTTSIVFVLVGAVVFIAGLGAWISQLLPGRGHVAEPLVAPEHRPAAISPALGTVAQLRPGMPGYRLRLPEKVHPISAGVKGGIAGGIVMPLPALLYGLVNGRGIWLPLNLLAGMVLPGVDRMPLDELEQFHPVLFGIGVAIHIVVAVTFGLLYGVMLPTLPPIARPLAWAALLMPLLWTAVSFLGTSFVSPQIADRIEWPWFIVSQFVFGVVLALFVMRFGRIHSALAGLLGGALGGILMAAPAMLWGYFSGHGVWYPVNLLAVMILPQNMDFPHEELTRFDAEWFLAATAVHAVFSLSFGLIFGLLLRKLPSIPGPFAWGALLMPLLWTSTSYALMRVVNPVLKEYVDWPWFVASQFVFGVVAAIVVVRSQQVAIAPAGRARQRSGSMTGSLLLIVAALVPGISGCGELALGKPDPADRPLTPSEIKNFGLLFARHCAGCHGATGKLGPAPPLDDPLFLAIVPDAVLHEVVANGRPGTPMPAFAIERGGSLTAEQVKIVAEGIKAHRQPTLNVEAPAYALPPASPTSPEQLARAGAVFERACAGCHAADAGMEDSPGPLNQSAMLALISDQALRRTIITGRRDLGMPSFAGKDGRPDDFEPLTSTEIDDLVALLSHWRANPSSTAAAK